MKTGIERMRQLATLSVKNKKQNKKDKLAVIRSLISLCDEIDTHKEKDILSISQLSIDKKTNI